MALVNLPHTRHAEAKAHLPRGLEGTQPREHLCVL
jgi:hypothetical protein